MTMTIAYLKYVDEKNTTKLKTKPTSVARAYIQRRDSTLTWSVILSVHGADPIAEVKLLISPFLR
jgi:hypothetical protein